MNTQTIQTPGLIAGPQWLKSYYFIRAGFSVAWVAAAFAVGRSEPQIAAALLATYPAWDAAANLVDAQRSGGLRVNRSQAFNVAVSTITTIAVVTALTQSMYAVLAVFGIWAIFTGLLQLATGLRRWKLGGQWAMVLSGAQSALAGTFFVARASGDITPSITDIAPYAAFGAFYFLVSAIWMTVRQARGRS